MKSLKMYRTTSKTNIIVEQNYNYFSTRVAKNK